MSYHIAGLNCRREWTQRVQAPSVKIKRACCYCALRLPLNENKQELSTLPPASLFVMQCLISWKKEMSKHNEKQNKVGGDKGLRSRRPSSPVSRLLSETGGTVRCYACNARTAARPLSQPVAHYSPFHPTQMQFRHVPTPKVQIDVEN